MKRYRHVAGRGVSLHVSAADDTTAARDALFYTFGGPLEGRRLPSSLTVDGAPFDVLWPATGPVVVPAARLPYAVINTEARCDGGRAGPKGGVVVRNTISDPTGRVKARPNESIYEAAFRAVRELRLGDAAETDLLSDALVFAASALGLLWLRARGLEDVAQQGGVC